MDLIKILNRQKMTIQEFKQATPNRAQVEILNGLVNRIGSSLPENYNPNTVTTDQRNAAQQCIHFLSDKRYRTFFNALRGDTIALIQELDADFAAL